MGAYKGDFDLAMTGPVVFMFNTFDSNDPSASVALSGIAITDIEIYKNGVATTRSSTSGYVLLDTDGIDFDSHVGIGGCSIDIDDNDDAGFFAASAEFDVIVASITVDSATVNFHAGSFSIERELGTLAITKLIQAAVITNAAGADVSADILVIDNFVDGIETAVIGNAAGADISADILVIDNFVDGIETAVIGNAAGADISADILVIDNFVDGLESTIGVAGAGLSDLGGMSTGMQGEVNTEVDNSMVTYGLDHLISAAVAGADVADNSIIADLVSSEVTTDYDDYVNTTDSLQAIRDHIGDGSNLTEAGATGDHLTAINLPNQTMDITGDITGDLSGSVGSVTAQVTADVTAISGDSTAADRLEAMMDGVLIFQVNGGSPSTTVFIVDGDVNDTTDDHYNGRLITGLTGANAGQQTDVTDWTGSTTLTLTVTALTDAPANDDFFIMH